MAEPFIALHGSEIQVGLSAIIGFTVVPGMGAGILKYNSGGTLWFGATLLSTIGVGYLVSSGEALSFNMTGTFYMTATGATVSAMFLYGKESAV